MRLAKRVSHLGWAAVPARLRAWSLLVALSPTLLFLGHWSLNLDIPGTNLYVVLIPGATGAAHDDHEAANDSHTRHCHAGVAACSDIPFTGVSAFALLSDTLAYFGAASALIVLAALCWRPVSRNTVVPELLPPRSPLFAG